MKPKLLLVILMLLFSIGAASAAPRSVLASSNVNYSGTQQATGSMAGLRIRADGQLPATFSLLGTGVHVHTVNLTTTEVLQAGVMPNRGGTDRSWDQVAINSATGQSGLELVVVPLTGGRSPNLAVGSTALRVQRAEAEQLVETAWVDSTRPVLQASVAGTTLASSKAGETIRVQGSFAISVWSWNFTATHDRSAEFFPTGVQQSGAVRNPITGAVVASSDFDQVAQIQVQDGVLDFADLSGATIEGFTARLSVTNVGRATLSQAQGVLQAEGAGQLAGRTLVADGTLKAQHVALNSELQVDVESFQGDMNVGGQPISLGRQGDLRQSGAGGGGLVLPGLPWTLGLGASLVALMLVMIVVQGPARTARFNRIQGHFESKDYPWVLQRIEPFTTRGRYRRRATVLKAVSLLSVKDYQEAALFLESLDATRGPDSATKAFLQACAAAGLGQGAFVLQHLTDCFRLDASYLEEARTVPVLAGYLPYFSITPEPA